MPELALYDSNGGFVGMADLEGVPTSDHSVLVDGRAYIWHQRSGQFREIGPTVLGSLSLKHVQAEVESAKAEAKMVKDYDNKMMTSPENKAG